MAAECGTPDSQLVGVRTSIVQVLCTGLFRVEGVPLSSAIYLRLKAIHFERELSLLNSLEAVKISVLTPWM